MQEISTSSMDHIIVIAYSRLTIAWTSIEMQLDIGRKIVKYYARQNKGMDEGGLSILVKSIYHTVCDHIFTNP
jgi:hypothetical protein